MKDTSSTKRVRFNSVEEVHELPPPKAVRVSRDEDLDSDGSDSEDGTQLESLKPRRGAVNLDGYDSDASSDGEKSSKNPKPNKSQDIDEDDDMFGDSPDIKNQEGDVEPNTGDNFNAFSSDPKNKELLNIDEIQGQEDSSDIGSDDEGAVRIEAFNLKDDMQEGKFDAQGNFVWNAKDPGEHHDSWLKGISKSEINKAKMAKEKQLERQVQLEKFKQGSLSGESETLALELLTTDEVKLRLINLMKPQESVLGSLSRLGGGSQSKKKRVNKNRAKKEALENVASPELNPEQETQRKKDINQLTELAVHLLDQGHLNIYQETYESLVRAARISELIPDDWIPGTLLTIPK